MLVRHARDASPLAVDPRVSSAVERVSASALEAHVRCLAFPRSLLREPEENRRAGALLVEALRGLGYRVERHGVADNILAWPPRLVRGTCLLAGAHFDSVPLTPGADDNASAVAAVLVAAEVLASLPDPPAVGFAFFNGEEDGLLGSREFAARLPSAFTITGVHVLEMVGFCARTAGSQRTPGELPLSLPGRGDFLAVLANSNSKALLGGMLSAARTYTADLPVLGLAIPAGLERVLPVLQRSDHAPFWKAGIPALMWTDTADFRNPHYHQVTDTPETLDYAFLADVTRLLVATLLLG